MGKRDIIRVLQVERKTLSDKITHMESNQQESTEDGYEHVKFETAGRIRVKFCEATGLKPRAINQQEKQMVTKKFNVDFFSEDGALTLPLSAVSKSDQIAGVHSRTHDSGWTITGEVHEDYYVWVNDFEALHPRFGTVKGNFEEEVVADSEEAFTDFWKNHEPEAWDYLDI
jgi:hypothetical protein